MKNYAITAIAKKNNLQMKVGFYVLGKSEQSAKDRAKSSWKEYCTSKLKIIKVKEINNEYSL